MLVRLQSVSRPVGVSVLAALGFLSGIVVILAGTWISADFLIPGLITLVLSWGLWNGKNLARILTIVFNILGILLGLPVGLLTVNFGEIAIISSIINAMIAIYLTRPYVVPYFKRPLLQR